MIRSIFNLLLAALLGAVVFPAQSADPTRTIRIEVAGLVCGFCAQGIDKQMRSFEETRDVYVNLERGVVAVELDPGADIADAVLDKALTDAGYTLTGITRVERPLVDVRREVEDGSR
jgi:mercuric ion binding protein